MVFAIAGFVIAGFHCTVLSLKKELDFVFRLEAADDTVRQAKRSEKCILHCSLAVKQ